MSNDYLYEYVYWRNGQPTLKRARMTRKESHVLNTNLEKAGKAGEFWAMTEESRKKKEERNKNNKR